MLANDTYVCGFDRESAFLLYARLPSRLIGHRFSLPIENDLPRKDFVFCSSPEPEY
jgi:hypothetical protein